MRTGSSSHRLISAVLLVLVGHALAGSAPADTPADLDQSTRPTPSLSILDGGDALRLSVEGTYLYGPIDGHLQTPAGGRPGTTSVDRPTFRELGIDHASLFDTALTLGRGRQEVYIGGQLIGLSGHATLDETLVSQNKTFPAGTEVDAEIQLNWYRAGYRYWFLFDTDGKSPGDELAIAPSVGAGFFSFSYKLDGPGDVNVDRSYIKPMPQVGLEAEWKMSNRFSIVGGALTSIPIPDTPFILSARLAGKYRVVDGRSMKVDALFGVGYERLQYDDAKKQDMPNDISVNLGPLLLLGLKAEF